MVPRDSPFPIDELADLLLGGDYEDLTGLRKFLIKLGDYLRKAVEADTLFSEEALEQFDEALIELQREVRATASTHAIELPWLPMTELPEPSIQRTLKLLAGTVEALAMVAQDDRA